MAITPKEVGEFVGRVAAAIQANETMLNEADGRLGDGDTGGMLARFATALAAAEVGGEPDIGSAIIALAKAGSRSTGSSFGTLLVTGLLALGKDNQGRAELDWRELAAQLSVARDAMMRRGTTELGAKTAIDSLDYVIQALAGANSADEVIINVGLATRRALDDFRDRPCRMGRARMYADGSKGLDDPGMLAIDIIAHAV